MTRLVQLPKPHIDKAEGMDMQMTIGRTKITFDTSYLDSRTEEQEKADQTLLTEAVWNLYDEMEEAV